MLLAARIPRYLALAYLGSQLGTQSWPWLMAHVPHLIAFALPYFVFLYLLVKYVDYKRGQRLTATE